jgi:hypothetical protein
MPDDDEIKEDHPEGDEDFPGIKGKKGTSPILPPDDDLADDDMIGSHEEDDPLKDPDEPESLDDLIDEELDGEDEPYDDTEEW